MKICLIEMQNNNVVIKRKRVYGCLHPSGQKVWSVDNLPPGVGGGGGGVCEGTSLHKRYKYVPSQRVGF